MFFLSLFFLEILFLVRVLSYHRPNLAFVLYRELVFDQSLLAHRWC